VARQSGSPSTAQTRPVLSIVEALSAGLDAVLRHPWLLLIPVLLDLFLWVGPRLQAPALYRSFEPALRQMMAQTTTSEARYAAQELGKSIDHFFTQYNLFAGLSAGLIGVPVVNSSVDATLPLVTGSAPILWQVDRFESYLLVLVICAIGGLLISALFWTLLGDYVRGERWQAARWLRRSGRVWTSLLLLMIIVVGLIIVSIFPLSMVMFMVGAFSAGLASLIPLLALAVMVWIIFVCMFTPHGLVVYRMPLTRAVNTSVQVVRANFAQAAGLAVIMVTISLGTGIIWQALAADSWLRLVAMAGNAIVGTGLIVASLLFYQNRVVILYEHHHWPLPTGN
jgi:hypothetical protein